MFKAPLIREIITFHEPPKPIYYLLQNLKSCRSFAPQRWCSNVTDWLDPDLTEYPFTSEASERRATNTVCCRGSYRKPRDLYRKATAAVTSRSARGRETAQCCRPGSRRTSEYPGPSIWLKRSSLISPSVTVLNFVQDLTSIMGGRGDPSRSSRVRSGAPSDL